MNMRNEIKKLAAGKGVTLSYLAACLSKKLNKPYSIQNLSRKLKDNSIRANELILILSELGYEITIAEIKK